uniref:Uncharacterized protein n=1 Tax=Cacopsylla melanoneura TaxID=428564 RepID=A0A8D8YYE8_9HEMI
MLVTTQPRMTDKSIQPIHHPHSCLSFLSFYVPVKLFCISFSALFLSKLLCIIILEHSRILSCLPIPISTILPIAQEMNFSQFAYFAYFSLFSYFYFPFLIMGRVLYSSKF